MYNKKNKPRIPGFIFLLTNKTNYFVAAAGLVVDFVALVDVFVVVAPFALVLVEVLLVIFDVGVFVVAVVVVEFCAKLTEPITKRAATSVMIFFILCDFFCKVNIKVSNWKYLFFSMKIIIHFKCK